MNRGVLRAGAGQGAAAAVQLLVTLSFLPSVVEAQVSPSETARHPCPTPAGPRRWRREAGVPVRSGRDRSGKCGERPRTPACAGTATLGGMAIERGRW
jgi:hypothetical protein